MRRLRTRIQRIRHRIEHVRIHISVDRPVGRGVVPRGDEDGVSLGDSDGDHVGGVFLGVDLWVAWWSTTVFNQTKTTTKMGGKRKENSEDVRQQSIDSTFPSPMVAP